MDDDWDGFGDNTAAEAPAVEAAEDPFAGDDAFGSQPNAAPSEESAPINDDSGFDFGSSEPTAAPVEAAPVENGLGGGMDDMFNDAAPVPVEEKKNEFAPVLQVEDNGAIEKWQAEQQEKLAQRRAASNAQKLKQMEAAKSELEKFDADRQVAIQSNKKANESAETEFVATRDNALKAGIAGKDSWEKVTSYLDLQADPKRANTVSRMKSVLIAVKATPPATKPNFGAAA